MAQVLSTAGLEAVFSYAGRTKAPMLQPLPTRIGGFGGVEGLITYLREQRISHIIDATHPFAAGMSRNAFEASQTTGLPLVRLERPAWVAEEGDKWQSFPSVGAIPAALPDAATRVFLAIGKQHIGLFAAKSQHHYLLRLVDAPDAPLPLPNAKVVVARGPFDAAQDRAMMEAHDISHVVAKNGGGVGARAKLDAARDLGLQVLMAERPTIPGTNVARDIGDVMRWLGH